MKTFKTLQEEFKKEMSIATTRLESGTLYSLGLHEDCADVNMMADWWKEKTKDMIDNYLTEWLRKFANKNLEDRKNAFDEVVDIRKGINKLYK